MKVAYNACYGGFGLSPIALDLYAKKKGITLTWYDQVGYAHNGGEKYARLASTPQEKMTWCYAPLKKNLGEEINSIHHADFYYPSFYSSESRKDLDLIATIEELGFKAASGTCAKLAIQEVPDGAEFEIDEYDGFESVEPPRQKW